MTYTQTSRITNDRKDMLKARRIEQLSRQRGLTTFDRSGHPAFQPAPFIHHGKFNGEDLREIRKAKGVGVRKVTEYNTTIGNREFNMWNSARIKRQS